MAGYPRDIVSIEQALRSIIKVLKEDKIKEVTNKSESWFRKCSDPHIEDKNIDHQDSINLDIATLKEGKGTFDSLSWANVPLELKFLFQLGFAVSLGVLIDTFIVRALLVPSMVAMLGEWSWWPRTVNPEKSEASPEPTDITSFSNRF